MTWIIRGSNAGLPSIAHPNYLSVTATMTSATWNTETTHEVFTVTGLVRLRMWIECTTNVTSSGGGATLTFGPETLGTGIIAATGEDDIDAGELWYDDSPTTAYDTYANAVFDYVVNGLDIGYDIDGEALTAGVLVFHCVWEPLNSTGNVTAGAGGALA